MSKIDLLTPIADFCETLISISKLRLSRKTLVTVLISTLKFCLRTLILNSQKFSNSHSRISTLKYQISEKCQPIWYCGGKKCLQSWVLFCLISQKTAWLVCLQNDVSFNLIFPTFLRVQCKFTTIKIFSKNFLFHGI